MLSRDAIRAQFLRIPPAAWLIHCRRRLERRGQFRRAFEAFARGNDASRLPMSWADRKPCLTDATGEASFDAHYILHTAWAARRIRELWPRRHVDIASSLYFCGIVSAFVPVDFYDYRPAGLGLSQLVSRRADLLALPFSDRTVPSLSCMHVVEHVGLGRYGDPLDPDGDLKAMSELQRVLSPGGSLLFVTPVGRPRVVFNAHRIYQHAQILRAFSELKLRGFALITEQPRAELIEAAEPALADAQSYGCGCFHFVRE